MPVVAAARRCYCHKWCRQGDSEATGAPQDRVDVDKDQRIRIHHEVVQKQETDPETQIPRPPTLNVGAVAIDIFQQEQGRDTDSDPDAIYTGRDQDGAQVEYCPDARRSEQQYDHYRQPHQRPGNPAAGAHQVTAAAQPLAVDCQ